MSDQNPPYEPPTGSGPPPPDSGPGSIYESASYQSPTPETPPEPVAQPVSGSAATPPPIAGAPPPGYEGGYAAPPGAYGPPQGYAAPPAKNNTQLFGILGIVFAVVCCPLLGILFGWMSMNEAKKTGSDDTLGKVGFWLGIAITAIALVTTIIAICAGGIGSWNSTRY